MFDARGSSWAKWDLHVHTPLSLVQNFSSPNGDVWEQYLSDLEGLAPEFEVLGINDYFFVDGYERLLAAQKSGRLSNIKLLLPVIELRLNVFGGTRGPFSKVNAHVIFSEQLDVQVIRDQFISALSRDLKLTPAVEGEGIEWSGALNRAALEDLGRQIIASVPVQERQHFSSPLMEGFGNLAIPLDDILQLLKNTYFNGRALLGVGKTEWADVKWTDASIAEKKNIINRADLVFTAAESPAAYQRGRNALKDQGVTSTLLDCSDAHDFSTSADKDRIGNCATWLKASPTFGGLRQALAEFERRVYVGSEPPELKRLREHPSRYVDTVEIGPTRTAPADPGWFDSSIPINPGLVAVIGNRGSGKSALAEAIALAGQTTRAVDFSFLTKSKFREPKSNPSKNFLTRLVWRDGETHEVVMSDDTDEGSPRVQHLPQRYLEKLCNELPQGQRSEFDRQLERIIFEHLPEEHRLGAVTLEERLEIGTAHRRTELTSVRARLTALNRRIVQLERWLSREEWEDRADRYRRARHEWYQLKQAPPPAVPEPNEGAGAQDAQISRLGDLNIARGQLFDQAQEVRVSLATLRRLGAELGAFRAELRALAEQHSELLKSRADLLVSLGLGESVVVLSVDTQALDGAGMRVEREVAELERALDPSDPRSFPAALEEVEEERQVIRSALAAPEERYQDYLAQLQAWRQEVVARLGNSEAPQTVLGLRTRLQQLNGLPEQLEEARSERLGLSRRIHELLLEAVREYAELYAPLEESMRSAPVTDDHRLSVDASLVDTGFAEGFLESRINRNVAGSFYGVEAGRRALLEILEKTDWDKSESALRFVESVHSRLHVDHHVDPPKEIDIASQLRKGVDLQDLYDFVFGFGYLSPRYALRFGERPIHQLSPGEKGVLLLIFFLVADLDSRPLIIDQPEDNLDNQTVVSALVGCFHQAKSRRQVIIVTHNPNLAVVCDADQVIVSTMTKTPRPVVEYYSGPIEDPEIAQAIVDVLEGTRPAFMNRRRKYDLHARRDGGT